MRPSKFFVAAVVAILVAEFSQATTFDWSNASGGAFSTASNWTPNGGPPGTGDIARFDLPNTYTVTFSGSPFVSGLLQTQGHVTLDLNNATLQFSNPISNSLGAANKTTTMRVVDGNFRPGNLAVGAVAHSNSTLYLDEESDTRVTSGLFQVGVAGTGNLWIQSGATLLSSSGTAIGVDSGSVGVATVAGIDSRWTINSQPLRVGSAGSGTLNIHAGGMVIAASLEVGEFLASTGTISVSGNQASFATDGLANIGGTNGAEPASSATLNIATGGTMTLAGTTNLRANAKVNLNGGRLNLNVLNVTPGAMVNWTAGTLNFESAPSITADVLNLFLDNTHTLRPNRTLSASTGTITIDTPLDLAGGLIDAPSISIGAGMHLSGFSSISAADTITLQPAAIVELRDFATIGATTSIVNNGGTLLVDGNLVAITGPFLNTAGSVEGTGRFLAGLTNETGGTIRVAPNDHLIIHTAGQTNAGMIELAQGTIEYRESLTNEVGGTIFGRGVFRGSSAVPGGAGLSNLGNIALSAGVTDFYGDLDNAATGKVIVAGASTATFYDDVINNGEIRTVGGSRSVFFGSVAGAGAFTGTGTVELEGDLKPGNSPANVQFGGDVVFGASAEINLELGGSVRGTEYDAVTIQGKATLSGRLSASLIDGFVPTAGATFEVLQAKGGIQGAFDYVSLPPLGGGILLNLGYESDSIVLRVDGIGGDYNLDGTVDAADYVLWRRTLGTVGSALAADGNHNQLIDMEDFSLWRSNVGRTTGGGGTNLVPVPEPHVLGLLLCAVLGALNCVQRNRS